MRAVDNIISERRLLEQIDYSLIVNLRYAFQDDENLFMVLDLMLGGDLRFHLERVGTLPEDQVRFYAAELALGLNYLHRRRIVHRYVDLVSNMQTFFSCMHEQNMFTLAHFTPRFY